MLRDLDIDHLQIRKRVAQHGRFFAGEIAARFFLNHRELVDEHFRQLQIHFALTGLRIWNLSKKQCGVLRVHHDKLDKALRELAALGTGLHFGHNLFLLRSRRALRWSNSGQDIRLVAKI